MMCWWDACGPADTTAETDAVVASASTASSATPADVAGASRGRGTRPARRGSRSSETASHAAHRIAIAQHAPMTHVQRTRYANTPPVIELTA